MSKWELPPRNLGVARYSVEGKVRKEIPFTPHIGRDSDRPKGPQRLDLVGAMRFPGPLRSSEVLRPLIVVSRVKSRPATTLMSILLTLAGTDAHSGLVRLAGQGGVPETWQAVTVAGARAAGRYRRHHRGHAGILRRRVA